MPRFVTVYANMSVRGFVRGKSYDVELPDDRLPGWLEDGIVAFVREFEETEPEPDTFKPAGVIPVPEGFGPDGFGEGVEISDA